MRTLQWLRLLRPEPWQHLLPRVAFPGARAAPLSSSAFGSFSPGYRSGVAAAAASSLLPFGSGSVPDRLPWAVVLVLVVAVVSAFVQRATLESEEMSKQQRVSSGVHRDEYMEDRVWAESSLAG